MENENENGGLVLLDVAIEYCNIECSRCSVKAKYANCFGAYHAQAHDEHMKLVRENENLRQLINRMRDETTDAHSQLRLLPDA